MKNLIILLAPFILILSCDNSIVNPPKSGTLDSVVYCIEKNDHKRELLGKGFIEDACAKKDIRRSTQDPTSECSAVISVTETNTTIELRSCVNKTEFIVTSIGAKVFLTNHPDYPNGFSETGEKDGMFVLPGGTISTTINITGKFPVEEKPPYCSSEPKKICTSWSVSGYEYIDPNI